MKKKKNNQDTLGLSEFGRLANCLKGCGFQNCVTVIVGTNQRGGGRSMDKWLPLLEGQRQDMLAPLFGGHQCTSKPQLWYLLLS